MTLIYLSNNQLNTFWAIGFLLFLISLIFNLLEKNKYSLLFLIATALFLFCFAALLDPFLNIFDERFHALVAKNLLNHPFKPTLYDDPVVNMAYDRWDKFHIWLHKQPLFLWQIALSFKLFGISEFTLRLPGVLLGAALVGISYRCGKLLVNERTGFIAGTLMLTSFFNLELISGRQAVDHNDFSFLVYISLSIWSLIEYHHSKKRYWIYLIGLFSGFAILCKWLAGLLVYSGWFILVVKERKLRLQEYKDIFLALMITVIIALPWQVYSFIAFPAEYKLTQSYNVKHIFEALDGHEGTFWYHFDEFNNLYGNFTSFLIIPAFLVLFRKIKDKSMFAALVGMVCITFIFFSFVKTKMPAFTTIASLPIYLALASLVDYGLGYSGNFIRNNWLKALLASIVIILIFAARFDIGRIKEKHSLSLENNSYSKMLYHNREIFKSISLPSNAVIFNVKGQHYIESMFYTGRPSYHMVPSLEQYKDMKSKGRIIAIFKPSSGEIPDYLAKDSSTIILDLQLQGYN
jgi:4-amino-4-deoxy-L-arabinose transferase-like glycosyltransferase